MNSDLPSSPKATLISARFDQTEQRRLLIEHQLLRRFCWLKDQVEHHGVLRLDGTLAPGVSPALR